MYLYGYKTRFSKMKILVSIGVFICLIYAQVNAQPTGEQRKGTITVRKYNTDLEVKENMDENLITNLSVWDGPVKNQFTFNFRYYRFLSIGPSYQRVFKLNKNTALLTGINFNMLMEDSTYSAGIPFELHLKDKPRIIKNFSYGVDLNWYRKFHNFTYTLSPRIGFNVMNSPLSIWYGRNFNLYRKNEITTINRQHITLRYNLYF